MKQSRIIEILSELGRRLEVRGGAAAVSLARHMLVPEVLAEWLVRYPFAPLSEPRNVLIVTAGNIPFVGVQDLICVLAAGHRALVRPSSRDRDNMAWVVAALLDIEPSLPVSLYSDTPPPSADTDIDTASNANAPETSCVSGAATPYANTLADTINILHAGTHEPPRTDAFAAAPADNDESPRAYLPPVAAITPDAVIAMGGDAAMVAIGARYAGLPTLLRGHRASAAVLAGDETADELRALADDVLLHSGLGCRNVSIVFVPRGYDFAPFAAALARWNGGDADGKAETAASADNMLAVALTRPNKGAGGVFVDHSNTAMPAGGYRQARAMLLMAGAPHIDCGTCLLVEDGDFSARPSVLNYVYYGNISEVEAWLERRDGDVQCVAVSPRVAVAYPRSVPLGDTQHPRPWDYPDGMDTMQFLARL